MEFYAHLAPGYLRNAIDRLAINPGEPEIESAPVAAMVAAATPSEPPTSRRLLHPCCSLSKTAIRARGDSEKPPA
jgi:hypothetical protein